MEKSVKIKSEYNSLDKLLDFLNKDSSYTCEKKYDGWDVRTDKNGQMEQCIVIKKSAMHGMKAYFSDKDTLRVTFIIPNSLMNAFFGKSQKRYQRIDQIILGKIKEIALSGSQKKAFAEMGKVFKKIEA